MVLLGVKTECFGDWKMDGRKRNWSSSIGINFGLYPSPFQLRHFRILPSSGWISTPLQQPNTNTSTNQTDSTRLQLHQDEYQPRSSNPQTRLPHHNLLSSLRTRRQNPFRWSFHRHNSHLPPPLLHIPNPLPPPLHRNDLYSLLPPSSQVPSLSRFGTPSLSQRLRRSLS